MAFGTMVDVDDTGDHLSGTLHNNAWLQTLQGLVDGVAIVFLNGSGTVNDLAIPGKTKDTYVQIQASAPMSITGIAGGAIGDRLTLFNPSAFPIFLLHGNGGSSAHNEFYNIAQSAPTPLGTNGSATYVHNGATWVLTQHEQGGWIREAFNAANYTTNNGATWTLQSTDEFERSYRLAGRTLYVDMVILNSSVSAGSPTALHTVIPGGFQVTRYSQMSLGILDNGTSLIGFMIVSLGAPTLIEFFHTNSATPWVASTNSTQVAGTAAFEVL